MSNIKAPYNFVPLHKEVVLPYWAKHISHDIPFSDTQSNSFDIKIKAHSPIMVVDGKSKSDNQKEDRDTQQFSAIGDQHFVPGSSIRGMLRSVLEVMAYGQMSNKVNDHRYALRDLNYKPYRENFTRHKTHGGWLTKGKDGNYYIQDTGIPGRISHKEIDKKSNQIFSQYFEKNGGFNRKDDKHKSAQHKYRRFAKPLDGHTVKHVLEDKGRDIYGFDINGKDKGTLVFTGQSGFREFNRKQNKMVGHFYEFIFWENQNKPQVVNDKVIENFFFAYYDHEPNEQSDDFKHWKKQLEKGEAIPVFFRKIKGEVTDMGLSYMYKLPYKYSIKEIIDMQQKQQGIDLAAAIFGYVEETENTALKGRVHIGHAKKTKGELDQARQLLLSTPRASYYPNYLRQNVDRNGKLKGYHYTTMMDDQAEIAGWKRYPIHQSATPVKVDTSNLNAEMLTKFRPLKAGAEFRLTISYHNLKLIELGALLSAITFHRTEEVYHSLGLAKPFGYGKVSLEIEGLAEDIQIAALKAFEAYMNVSLRCTSPEWHQLEQIRELITMASDQDNSQERAKLAYMQLKKKVEGSRREENEFVNAKRRNNLEALAPYSTLPGINKRNASTLLSEAELKDWKAQIDQDKVTLTAHKKGALGQIKKQLQAAFCVEFEAKKQQLLEEIALKRNQIRAKEKEEQAATRAEKAKERQATAQAQGPDLSAVDVTNRNALTQLRKTIENYALAYYQEKKFQDILKKQNNGIVPTEYQEELKSTITAIFQAQNKKNKRKWLKPNSEISKRAKEWMGEAATKDLMGTLK